MAAEAEHIACANRTQQTIAHLLQDPGVHAPWIATAAFYKAVHVVEAVFVNDPLVQHTSDHESRENALRSARKYEHIYRHYSVLKRASTNARYLSECRLFDDYMSPLDVVDILLKHHLHQLEQSARKKLSSASAAALDGILAIFQP